MFRVNIADWVNTYAQEGELDQDGNKSLWKMSHRRKEEHGMKLRRSREKIRDQWTSLLDNLLQGRRRGCHLKAVTPLEITKEASVNQNTHSY
jgi:hypothetical protein